MGIGKDLKDRALNKAKRTATSPAAKRVAKATVKDLLKNVVAKRLFLRKWSKKLIKAFDGDEVAISEFLKENFEFSKEEAKRYAMLIVRESDS